MYTCNSINSNNNKNDLSYDLHMKKLIGVDKF